ncbi:MAG: FYDLN acid domain-containing protein [Nitrospinota bacterium]
MSHPEYGLKYCCFNCELKFYDLNKPEPICPKCGLDQRKAVKKAASPKVAPKRKKVLLPTYENDDEKLDPDSDDVSSELSEHGIDKELDNPDDDQL